MNSEFERNLDAKYKRDQRQNLLNIITGNGGSGGYGGNIGYGGGGNYGGGSALYANANATPVKLLQKFVNDRGWGNVDTTGMADWRGNITGAQPQQQVMQAQQSADADRWKALASLLGGGFVQYRN